MPSNEPGDEFVDFADLGGGRYAALGPWPARVSIRKHDISRGLVKGIVVYAGEAIAVNCVNGAAVYAQDGSDDAYWRGVLFSHAGPVKAWGGEFKSGRKKKHAGLLSQSRINSGQNSRKGPGRHALRAKPTNGQ